jgi:hypothetical protein
MPTSVYFRDKGITVEFPDDMTEEQRNEIVVDIALGKIEIPEDASSVPFENREDPEREAVLDIVFDYFQVQADTSWN